MFTGNDKHFITVEKCEIIQKPNECFMLASTKSDIKFVKQNTKMCTERVLPPRELTRRKLFATVFRHSSRMFCVFSMS